MKQRKIEIVGVGLTLEEFTLDTRVNYAGWVIEREYKKLAEKIVTLTKQMEQLQASRTNPLMIAKTTKLEKEYQKLSSAYSKRLDETSLEDWTEAFESENEVLGTELQAKADELKAALNPQEKLEQMGEEFDAVQKEQRDLDLQFLISQLEPDEQKAQAMFEQAKPEDAVLAHQWVLEGNALLARSLKDSLPNRETRRVNQRNVN